VPALPPAAITAGVDRARARLAGLHRALAPPPIRIIEGLFGLLEHRVLVALCAARVPEALTRRMRPAELARMVTADADRLERLLRFAATRGWVGFDRRGRVRPTRVTRFLRRDHPGGWHAWVDFMGGDEILRAITALDVAERSSDAFESANGSPFFTWMTAHPERAQAFDAAMSAGGRMHGLVLAAAIDWSRSLRVCDVGGGNGALLVTLLELLPQLEAAVFDRPEVVDRTLGHERLVAIGGDAFVQVPVGYDTYLLVNVVHDWGDDDARVLLSRVGDAAGPDARVIVVEGTRTTVPHADITTATDVLMAVLTRGGRERDANEFAALARTAGLQLVRTTRLASGDVAHELRHERAPSSSRQGDDRRYVR
jgi:hypothetical protein